MGSSKAGERPSGKAAKKSRKESAKKSGRKSAKKDSAKKDSANKAVAVAPPFPATGPGRLPAPKPAPGHLQERRTGAGPSSATEAFRVPRLVPPFSSWSTVGADIGPESEKQAEKAMEDISERLAQLQERLYAQGQAGDRRRVLVILQGMDTSGKDGVTRHVLDAVNPLGLHLASFKKPTAEELAHDFLWRIEKQVPEPGVIGVFNRSQYEDVLVVRVHELVPPAVWGKRFAQINAFERRLYRQGVTVLKCFLHISPETQKERLLARLDDPEKYWKYNPGDVDERAYWDAYQAAYADVLRRCNTLVAPWHVIPSDEKWYRNWAVAQLLVETLERIDPQFPPADFDVEAERARLEQL
ncbi:polyphosphate kinase 2 family protein [Nakamurella sp. YIM 132087]|uniref:Polyphosphate kinase 2 family protein n=1 Tax=Nakamurella alba TaxID=2665158 RepID=A0A7K1FQJ5_9ACTN|nr:polyphosphate kinase 2 family protein [Nakamurella alba]MTD16411.1 polyphosphate kinase 2 family protein [Nakamurella alba]